MERAQGKHASEGLFPSLIRSLTLAASQRPWATLSLVLFVTLCAGGITLRFLTFKTNRSDLIAPDSEFHHRWLDFVDRFGDDSDVVVVVEGSSQLEIVPAIDWLGSQLEQDTELFDRVLYRIDPRALQSKALQYLDPVQLEQAQQRLEMYGPILAGHWDRAGLEAYCLRLSDFISQRPDQTDDPELQGAIAQAAELGRSLNRALQNPDDFLSPWPLVIPPEALPGMQGIEPHYQLTPSGTMGFLLALPREVSGDFSGSSPALSRLRQLLSEARERYPELTFGMTGIPVLEADEMERSQIDMGLASIISMTGVGLILLIGFRGFRHPLLAMIMLGVGLVWSLGYTTLAVGHLNILSVSFAAILIGLGIDFAIHYLAKYLELRHQGQDLVPALESTSVTVGTATITAAVTTALAFLSATFTTFLGVAELGIIAGGGILLCALATFVVLPALVAISDRRRAPHRLPTPFQATQLRRLVNQSPRAVAIVSTVILLGIGCLGFQWTDSGIGYRVKYDYNLLNLQAQGIESVELQNRIFEESNGSLLYAVSLTDSPQKVRLLKEKFLSLPTVSRVDELASYLPAYPAAETNLLVQAMHARLGGLSDLPREFPVLNPLKIGHALESLHATMQSRAEPAAQQAATQIDTLLDSLEQLSLDEQLAWLAGYQQRLLISLHRQFQALYAISDPVPISPDDFPDALRKRFVSDAGDWLLRIFPAQQVWDEDPLTEFVGEVRSVDPDVTGTPLQNFEAAREIQESYLHAAIYSLAIIMLVLLIDTLSPAAILGSLLAPLAAVGLSISLSQSSGEPLQPFWLIGMYLIVAVLVAAVLDPAAVCYMLLALLPPLGGLIVMFGILSITGIDLNPANLIVLPLILGIGVDDGVHVIHDFRRQPGRYEISPSTINAITLTSLTSMVGFGSMIMGAHRGLNSLGTVLVIGLGSCLFISLVLLPSVLTWISSRRSAATEQETENTDSELDPDEASAPHIVPLPRTSTMNDVA